MKALRLLASRRCAVSMTMVTTSAPHRRPTPAPSTTPLRVAHRTYFTASHACLKKARRPLRASPVPPGTPLDGNRRSPAADVASSVSAPPSSADPTPAAATEAEPSSEAAASASAVHEAPRDAAQTPDDSATMPATEATRRASSEPQTAPDTPREPTPASSSEVPPTQDPTAASEPPDEVRGEASASRSEEAPTEPSYTKRMFASWQQGVVGSIGAAMGVGFLIYVLYAPVKEDTVHHTAMVASEALADLRIKKQAVSLSKEVVANVLQDPQSAQLVSQLVVTLLAQEETKVAISSLLQSLFEDHYTQEVTKKFVLMIVRDPWIEDQVQSIVKEQVLLLLEDAEIKLALSQFLLDSASDSLARPDLHYTAARAARSTIGRFFNPWWSV